MKFSIGVRLFFAVLLSMLAVSALLLLFMRAKIGDSFAEYAQKIELDRLQEVSDSLEVQYARHGNWAFLPQDAAKKQQWIKEELFRLYTQRLNEKSTASNSKTTPAPAIAPIPAPDDLAIPSTPPLPPLPPLPPPPPPMPDDLVAPDAPDLPDFFSRISLFDVNQRYLAGQQLKQLPESFRPLFYKGKIIAYLGIQESPLPSDSMSRDFLAEQTDTIILSIVASILFSAIIATLLAYHFRRPLLRLVSGAKQLAEGHFELRLPDQRSDELGDLAHSFNQLAIQLAKVEQSRRQWVADTSHELRTPISVLRAQLEAIQDGIRCANPDNIALLLRQVLSLNKLIDELYLLARSDLGELAYHFQNMDLRALILEEVANFSEKLMKAQLTTNLQLGDVAIWIKGDPDRMRQVLINLLENSVRYTEAGGQIRISVSTEGVKKKLIRLRLEDSAPGLTPTELARLGERFYRAEASRNRDQGGAGLGLALCKKITLTHGGKLSFSTSELGGITVDIQLPASPQEP